MVGIIVAAYAIPQMLFRIPIGVLFDIITRRKFLIAGGIMMSSVGAMGLGLAPSALLLFFARGITGIGAAAENPGEVDVLFLESVDNLVVQLFEHLLRFVA